MSAAADGGPTVDEQVVSVAEEISMALHAARALAVVVGRAEPHGRNVAMTITHLEDALLRLRAPSVLS